MRDPLARALLVLTFSTGLVDAVSYLGLGRVFAANMTGNVVLLGFGTRARPGIGWRRVKASYDPGNVFRLNQSIPPAAG